MSEASSARRPRRYSIGIAADWFFFVFAGVATAWLAIFSFDPTLDVGWWTIVLVVLFWALIAYLVLPRLHRILTTVYVPDYFIGRARTSDGLLGDPVNLAVLGTEEELRAAMAAAGWTAADPVSLRSSVRIVASTVRRESYAEAPVSPLFLFGHQQDLAYQQEVDGNPAQRHHVRFWRCPEGWLLPGGRRVDWVAAGTFDRAVGLSLFTLQVTHKIDADTDVERDHVVNTLSAAPVGARVEVIADFSTGYHARNGGGDSIHTDGDLPIIDLRRDRDLDTAPAARTAAAAADEPAHDRSQGDAVPKAPAKRASSEGVGKLLEPTRYDPHMRRPVTIAAGAFLVLVRAVVGTLAGLGAFGEWDDTLRNAGTVVDALVALLSTTPGSATPAIIGVGLAGVGFAVCLFVGWNAVRVLVMVAASIDIVVSFASWQVHGGAFVTFGDQTAVAVDILILLALSSRSAAAYARRNER